MKEQTSFDIEDAEALLKQLQEFDQTIQQEWSKVLSQWGNLQPTWQDAQFDKFEPLLEKLSTTYNAAKLENEIYIGYLEKQIEIAKKPRCFNLLEPLEKALTNIQLGMSIVSINASPPTQTVALPQQPSSSYVQQKEPNSCSINEKLDPEKSPAVQYYNSMPAIARVINADAVLIDANGQFIGKNEQLNEAYTQEKEQETKRRKKEIEDSTMANQQPQAPGSPNPNPSVNA